MDPFLASLPPTAYTFDAFISTLPSHVHTYLAQQPSTKAAQILRDLISFAVLYTSNGMQFRAVDEPYFSVELQERIPRVIPSANKTNGTSTNFRPMEAAKGKQNDTWMNIYPTWWMSLEGDPNEFGKDWKCPKRMIDEMTQTETDKYELPQNNTRREEQRPFSGWLSASKCDDEVNHPQPTKPASASRKKKLPKYAVQFDEDISHVSSPQQIPSRTNVKSAKVNPKDLATDSLANNPESSSNKSRKVRSSYTFPTPNIPNKSRRSIPIITAEFLESPFLGCLDSIDQVAEGDVGRDDEDSWHNGLTI